MMKMNYEILNDGTDLCENDIMEMIYVSRGIKDIDHFLNPTEEDLLPLEDLFYIDKAADIVIEGINNGATFGVLYDPDTDGISSGTIMTRYLMEYTANVKPWINQGKSHGLLNPLVFNDCDIVIIVDSLNGIETFDNYKQLHDMGKQIIVLDHHAINPNLPYDKYITLVSSQREYKNKELSGAGVVWKFCKYLGERFGDDYAEDLVEFAAIGILADVSAVGEENKENRYIVNKGLRNQKNLGVKKILSGYEFNSKAALFSIAPLINATCRVGDNFDAMYLFLTDDNKEALKYKKKLESYKEKQNAEVERLMPGIIEQVEAQSDKSVLDIRVDSVYGIGGLIGNKLLELYNKPMFLIGGEDENNLYGSMRSVGYGNFMKLCNDIGIAILEGHEEASGIRCDKSKYELFLNLIREKISSLTQTTTSDIKIDCELNVSDITRSLAKKVHDFNFITGKENKSLQFKVNGMTDYNIKYWKGGKHLVIDSIDSPVAFIQWNAKCDVDEMGDHELMNDEIVGFGEIEDGFVGRQYMIKLILNNYEVE